jgi:hypothetical protein
MNALGYGRAQLSRFALETSTIMDESLATSARRAGDKEALARCDTAPAPNCDDHPRPKSVISPYPGFFAFSDDPPGYELPRKPFTPRLGEILGPYLRLTQAALQSARRMFRFR